MSGWKSIPFSKLYLIPSRNGLMRPSAVRGGGFPFINMGELFANDRIYDMDMELVELNSREQREATVNDGDLLFARQSLVFEGAGKCSLVISLKKTTAFESHLIRVRLNPTIADPRFYYYYFNSSFKPIRPIVQQCAQAGVRGSDLDKLKVIYPSITTQRRIASVLSAYDELIEKNNRKIAILQEQAQELYKEWFVRFRFPGFETAKFENGLPEGWSVMRVDAIGEVVGGGTPSTAVDEYWNGDIPWLTPADLSGNTRVFVKSGESYITALGLKSSGAKMLPANTVLLSSRAPVGYVAISANPICTNQGFKSVICNSSFIYPFYMYFYFKNNREMLENYATGATFPELSATCLKKIKIVVPRKEIQGLFEKYLQPILRTANEMEEQNIALTHQRDLLLPRLMSGKLEV